MLSRAARRVALTVHVTLSVGWIGTVVAYLALGTAARSSDSEATVRSMWTAMELIGWYVIVPIAVGSLATGVLMALGTSWGLFRHYWVIISLLLTTLSTAVLLLHMPDVSTAAAAAQRAEGAALRALGGDLFHPAVGLVVLVVVQVLNVYKPRGVTRYGQRRLSDR